MKIKLFKLHKG